jgi:hypothetical protein
MSYLPLDAVFKRKKLEEEQEKFGMKVPDKRRFRAKMGIEESIEKSIITEFLSYGISSDDIPRMVREFKRIKHYQTLNPTLFLVVYFYFSSERNADFELVAENFDYDFQQILANIYTRGLFGGRKFTPVEEYKFRQDFVTYMMLIWTVVNKTDEENTTEEIGEEIADFNEQYAEPIDTGEVE